MGGMIMTANTISAYDGLSAEYKSLVDDFIKMLTLRQNENSETLKVIEDARRGVGLSKAYSDIDDLIKDLDAED